MEVPATTWMDCRDPTNYHTMSTCSFNTKYMYTNGSPHYTKVALPTCRAS